jgi:hypothetical protein
MKTLNMANPANSGSYTRTQVDTLVADHIKIVNATCANNQTVAANSGVDISTGISVPDGYSFAFAACRYTGNYWCHMMNGWVDGTSVKITMANVSSSTQTINFVVISVVFVKNE